MNEAKDYSNTSSEFCRIKSVCYRYGISPATVWRKSKEGTFPKPHKLSAGITVWKNSELLKWEENPLNYTVEL